jgi:bifunctional non-homologous end joining protein LigD
LLRAVEAAMSLAKYRKKRDFRKTREPAGSTVRANPRAIGRSRFVIQKHAASRLHFDFRLEFDGVLKSWAVPKGPSLDPGVKALAMEVEDHPVDYGGFEGTIPQGEYGGGTVMLWDRGTWEPEDATPAATRAAFKKGHLKFTLHGERLTGSWTLQRIRLERGRAPWLLIKRSDDAARPGDRHGVVERETTSIDTQRTMDEIAAGNREWTKHGARTVKRKPPTAEKPRKTTEKTKTTKKVKSASSTLDPSTLDGAKRGRVPKDFSPQLATLSDHVPEGDEWLHEMKFDGYRILAEKHGAPVRLVTRNGNDWTAKFSRLAEAVAALPTDDCVLDGELTAVDERGVTHFQKLQNAIREGRQSELIYYAFDLPFCAGYDLRAVPLAARKDALAELLRSSSKTGAPKARPIRFSDHIVGTGSKVLAEACKNGLEGIVSKQAESRYESTRNAAWLKTKCHGRQEFVVAGYTPPGGARHSFGSLLLGYYDKAGELQFSGKVGTGFDDKTLTELKSKMDKLATEEMPFVSVPRAIERERPTWLKPKLVAEIEFTEWTADGALRHPSFQGLREDKKASEVVREKTIREKLKGKAMAKRSTVKTKRARAAGHSMAAKKPTRRKVTKKSDGDERPVAVAESHVAKAGAEEFAGVRLTHPERVLFKDAGLTKLDIAEYFAKVADWILPYVVNRPVTLVRCPEGEGGECFFQKHWTESLPDAVGQVSVPMKSGKEAYVAISDLSGLIGLVQMSVLELHPWGARADDLEHPDQITFDLDPAPDVKWDAVVQAAQDLRAILKQLKLETFVRTSGGKGLHVVLPLARKNTWDEAAGFAHNIALGLANHEPTRFVANMRKELRKGKIFVDYLRNQRGSTSVANYSTRNRPGAPVAVPITWKELTKLRGPAEFTVMTVPKRLAKLKRDPWDGFFAVKQTLTKAMLDAAEKFGG